MTSADLRDAVVTKLRFECLYDRGRRLFTKFIHFNKLGVVIDQEETVFRLELESLLQ